ncbi:hypothetical protein A5792_28465 [Mycolicibacterium peregrinum]|uniref:Uncharacterized protein n=1 Tax=Mycolicibacterium peregrinum TaxID=43304 RepID=A0A1A0QTU2_MYCPR|nr:hypothetical protein A5792_28465 [Mycolicibacterium peregrinum]
MTASGISPSIANIGGTTSATPSGPFCMPTGNAVWTKTMDIARNHPPISHQENPQRGTRTSSRTRLRYRSIHSRTPHAELTKLSASATENSVSIAVRSGAATVPVTTMPASGIENVSSMKDALTTPIR